MSNIANKIGLVTLLVMSLTASAKDITLSVQAVNGLAQARQNEPVVINIAKYKALSAKVVSNGGVVVPCQLDDMDGDLVPDELVFVADIPASGKSTFTVTLSDTTKQEAYTPRVYGALILSDRGGNYPHLTALEAPGSSYLFNDVYQHGAVFESELTAYRVYFDQRQNVDLYGKSQRRIELPVTHFYTTAEQMTEGYGNDVLWAGNSIGAGTFKLWNVSNPTQWDNVVTRGQRVISAGPVRTVIELIDKGVVTPSGTRVNVRQHYIIYAGHRDCSVTAYIEGTTTDFVTGVQKIGANPVGFVDSAKGIAASWGADYPDMGKKELYPPEAVGLAICVNRDNIVSSKTDDLNYLFVVAPNRKGVISYSISFCADKEKVGYHSADEWFKSLENWKLLLDNPVKITIK
jgi:hypothetical protein